MIKNYISDNLSVRYSVFGNGQRNIVIIPGLSIKSVLSNSFEKNIFSYLNDFTFYIIDRREDIPEFYNAFDAADDTMLVLQAIGVSNFYLLGISQGGLISQIIALKYPESVVKLALCSTFCCQSKEIESKIFKWKDLAENGKKYELYETVFKNIFSEHTFSKYQKYLKLWSDDISQNDIDRFLKLSDICNGIDISDEIRAIRCPTIIFGSVDDKIISLESINGIANRIQCQKYLFNGYGHALQDEADDFYEKLVCFFNGLQLIDVYYDCENLSKKADYVSSIVGSKAKIRPSKIYNLCLIAEEKGVVLSDGNLEYFEDYSDLLKRVEKGRVSSEKIIKAAKIKSFLETPIAVDATAGLGEDSFILAAYGYNVILLEKNPVIYVLLDDAIQRAKNDPETKYFAEKMNAKLTDSTEYLKNMDFVPDLIYLDPMFPDRKKSGLIKKKFQLLHMLEKPCEEEYNLIDAAINSKSKKIIIKRPLHADNLANIKPSYSIKGESIRFDCIVII